jgi:hypothetical protein
MKEIIFYHHIWSMSARISLRIFWSQLLEGSRTSEHGFMDQFYANFLVMDFRFWWFTDDLISFSSFRKTQGPFYSIPPFDLFFWALACFRTFSLMLIIAIPCVINCVRYVSNLLSEPAQKYVYISMVLADDGFSFRLCSIVMRVYKNKISPLLNFITRGKIPMSGSYITTTTCATSHLALCIWRTTACLVARKYTSP